MEGYAFKGTVMLDGMTLAEVQSLSAKGEKFTLELFIPSDSLVRLSVLIRDPRRENIASEK